LASRVSNPIIEGVRDGWSSFEELCGVVNLQQASTAPWKKSTFPDDEESATSASRWLYRSVHIRATARPAAMLRLYQIKVQD